MVTIPTKLKDTSIFRRAKAVAGAKKAQHLHEQTLVASNTPEVDVKQKFAEIATTKRAKPTFIHASRIKENEAVISEAVVHGLVEMVSTGIMSAEIFEGVEHSEVAHHVNYLFEEELLSISDFCTDAGTDILFAIKKVAGTGLKLEDHPTLEEAVDNISSHVFESFAAEYKLIADQKAIAESQDIALEESGMAGCKRRAVSEIFDKSANSIEAIIKISTQAALVEGAEADPKEVPAALLTFSIIKALECFGIDRNVV